LYFPKREIGDFSINDPLVKRTGFPSKIQVAFFFEMDGIPYIQSMHTTNKKSQRPLQEKCNGQTEATILATDR
jgi:hypothetical protein